MPKVVRLPHLMCTCGYQAHPVLSSRYSTSSLGLEFAGNMPEDEPYSNTIIKGVKSPFNSYCFLARVKRSLTPLLYYHIGNWNSVLLLVLAVLVDILSDLGASQF
jgi:hypothetical protein